MGKIYKCKRVWSHVKYVFLFSTWIERWIETFQRNSSMNWKGNAGYLPFVIFSNVICFLRNGNFLLLIKHWIWFTWIFFNIWSIFIYVSNSQTFADYIYQAYFCHSLIHSYISLMRYTFLSYCEWKSQCANYVFIFSTRIKYTLTLW